MKKIVIKKKLVPVLQVTLDNSVINCIDSIKFRVNENKISNKISSIYFTSTFDSKDVIVHLCHNLELTSKNAILNQFGFVVGLNLDSHHIYLVKDDTIELHKEIIVSEEI